MKSLQERLLTAKTTAIWDLFPHLADINISVTVTDSDSEYLFQCSEKTRREYEIAANMVLENASGAALYGGIAHELAHISREESLPVAKRVRDDIVYLVHALGKYFEGSNGQLYHFAKRRLFDPAKKYVIRDERETDMLVVEKGAGRELLALVEFHDSLYEDYESTDGLTASELREILKKQSK